MVYSYLLAYYHPFHNYSNTRSDIYDRTQYIESQEKYCENHNIKYRTIVLMQNNVSITVEKDYFGVTIEYFLE